MPSRKQRQKSPSPSAKRSGQSNVIQHATNLIEDAKDPPPANPIAHSPPANWDPAVTYLALPVASPYLTSAQRRWLQRKPHSRTAEANTHDHPHPNQDDLPVIKLPLSRSNTDSLVAVRLINDPTHPAHGQRGLFATRDLAPGELVIPYIGYVHSSTASERAEQQRQRLINEATYATARASAGDAIAPDVSIDAGDIGGSDREHLGRGGPIGSWDISSYDLNLHRDPESGIELAIDAAAMGNEARFCNDYRGVPALPLCTGPEAEARWDRRSKRGAKSWAEVRGENVEGAGGSMKEGDGSTVAAIAIPNAEFRDVWFEWEASLLAEGNNTPDSVADEMSRFQADNKTLNVPQSTAQSSKQVRRQARRRKNGMRGVAIFVLPAGKSGKRKSGIKAGQEVLVSYGKGFWAHHGLEGADEDGKDDAIRPQELH